MVAVGGRVMVEVGEEEGEERDEWVEEVEVEEREEIVDVVGERGRGVEGWRSGEPGHPARGVGLRWNGCGRGRKCEFWLGGVGGGDPSDAVLSE